MYLGENILVFFKNTIKFGANTVILWVNVLWVNEVIFEENTDTFEANTLILWSKKRHI